MLSLRRVAASSATRLNYSALGVQQNRLSSGDGVGGVARLSGAEFLPWKGYAASKKPIKFKVEKGKTYMWCACGYSRFQPLCDGSHDRAGKTMNRPVKYVAQKDGEVMMCNCKQTDKRPLCDGSHRKMPPGPLPHEKRPVNPLVAHRTSPVDFGYVKKLGLTVKDGYHF